MQCQSMAASARLGIKAEICLLGEAVTFFLYHCPGFNKEISIVGPRLVAFVASLLFSRGLAGVLCQKYPREAQVFSGSPVDVHLAGDFDPRTQCT